jgi:4-amino-4-deoxy-L-arabinose transferase-like glycosyltransferase
LNGLGREETTRPQRDSAPLALAAILACYLVLGALYAWETPRWQTPDEPAHFNYIQYVAQENHLPVLEPGDYPHQYLEEIKAARFPPDMPIAPLRYESHQPPLYYVLAAILYRATAGLSFDLRLLALRLFSVLLGAAALWVTYRVLHESFPEPGFVSVAATALVATVPMHLAMTAAINNDALAELLLALLLWQAVRAIQKGLTRGRTLAMGVLLGLALLTKTTIYLVAGGTVLLTALLSQPSAGRSALRAKAGALAVVLALALLLALPFFVRNARIYGGLDILGWQRHDSIVAGQLRTVDLIAQTGFASFARRLVLTTFRSFWAQFGWMGVLVDERIYLALALLTALLTAGLAIFLVRLWRRRQSTALTAVQGRILLLFGAAIVLTVLTYLGYNIEFVQHQGRYLFPALIPLALASALGLQELLRPRVARALAAGLLLLSLVLLIHGIVVGAVLVWGLLLLLAATVFLASAGWLLGGHTWPLAVLLYVAALALDWICLFGFIVPALRL